MKKNVRIFLYQRRKGITWADEPEESPDRTLENWPDLQRCLEAHYKTSPGFKQNQPTLEKPLRFGFAKGFVKSVDQYCTTKALQFKLIDSMAKVICRIPSSGMRDAPIKEKPGLRHFYVSAFWRVFYRKTDDYLRFEEFCPHKKAQYNRRS